MTEEHRFSIVTPTQVAWPDSLRIPLSRFRLFVAADTSHSSVEEISAFAEGALIAGMVYFCAWGPGCERFHDIVDEIIADDRVWPMVFRSGRRLEEGRGPTGGYIADSDYRVLVCIGQPEWAATVRRFMRQAPYLI